jgi:CMP-N,N'-diacetyllegionaminic acid synthase
MNAIGIVPARSGSTRVVDKNVRTFGGGDSLLVRTIHTALRSNLDRVIVSTDSEEYAALARDAGAEAPFLRPDELSGPRSTAMSVVQHCLDFLGETENAQPDAVAYLQPTSPFRKAEDINAGLDLMQQEDVDTVLSLEQVRQLPAYMWKQQPDGTLVRAIPELDRSERSQDQPPFLVESACIIISRTGYLRNAALKDLIMNHQNFAPLLIETETAIDINTEQDFAYAEFVAGRNSVAAGESHG